MKLLRKLAVLIAILLAVVAVFLFLAIAGAFDLDRREYSSKREASSDQVFEKGWLLDIIPDSSEQILVIYNRDIGTSEGSFSFAPSEAERFINDLTTMGKQGRSLNVDYEEFEEVRYLAIMIWPKSGTFWRFIINPKQGRCVFLHGSHTPWMELLNTEKEGEQGGTGQPATRSQSSSEGSDKPQPEAEGRSR